MYSRKYPRNGQHQKIMSYGANPAQIELHMHLLRQWMTPSSQQPNPNPHPGMLQESNLYPSYRRNYPLSTGVSCGQGDLEAHSTLSEPDWYSNGIRRAQTTSCLPPYSWDGFYPDSPSSTPSYGEGDLGAFDD